MFLLHLSPDGGCTGQVREEVRRVSEAQGLSRHPEQTHFPILFFRTLVETDRIVKSACHNIYGRNVLQISPVHLWADVADMLLDFPYTLAAAALAVEQSDVAGIALWIVGTNQTQEC